MIKCRMTRSEYIQALNTRQRKPSILETTRLLAIRARQAMVKAGLITPKKKQAWHLCDTTGNISTDVVYAHTKSEARSVYKKMLGIKNRRLTRGLSVVKSEPGSQKAA